MTVERLRLFQEELWDERVMSIHLDPDHKLVDLEIEQAFTDRGLERRSFDVAKMEYREADFPEIPFEIGEGN